MGRKGFVKRHLSQAPADNLSIANTKLRAAEVDEVELHRLANSFFGLILIVDLELNDVQLKVRHLQPWPHL